MKKKSSLPVVLILGVLTIALVAGGLLISSDRTGGTRTSNATQPQPPQPPRASVQPGADPPQSKGRADAPVMIEEFGDYQCPPCGFLHPVMSKIQAQYGERLHFVFRQLPLTTIHKNAAQAARSAEAAGLQGKFWGMHDLLFEHQNDWKDLPDPTPTFNGYAQRLGLDVERFKADVQGQQVNARISADLRRAASLGVTGTPTLFINGMQTQSLEENDLRRDIESAMSRQGR